MIYTNTVTSDAYVSSSYSCFPSEALVSLSIIPCALGLLTLTEQQMETGEPNPKVTVTRTTGPIQTVTQTVHEIMTAVKQRRWKSPHGSPTNHRVKPSKVHKSKPSEDSLKETPTVSEHDILTAVKHRRWKSPHGSPTHGHIEPSSVHSTKTLKLSSKDTTTSSLSQSKDSSSKTLATPTSSGSCTPVGPDVTDTPASRDKNTGLLFRSSCGVSDATVSECPYLCSQAGGGLFKQCSNEDFTGDEAAGQFPPAVCT